MTADHDFCFETLKHFSIDMYSFGNNCADCSMFIDLGVRNMGVGKGLHFSGTFDWHGRFFFERMVHWASHLVHVGLFMAGKQQQMKGSKTRKVMVDPALNKLPRVAQRAIDRLTIGG